MAVASSSPKWEVEKHLRDANIYEYFDCIVCGDMIKNSKPAPDIYLAVAQKLGVQPDECLVFEDIEMGILAGKNAGMEVCAIEDDFSMDQMEIKKKLADYYIKDYTEVF